MTYGDETVIVSQVYGRDEDYEWIYPEESIDTQIWRSPHRRIVLDSAANALRRSTLVTFGLGSLIMIDSFFTQEIAGIAAESVQYIGTVAGSVWLHRVSEFLYNLPACDDLVDNGGDL